VIVRRIMLALVLIASASPSLVQAGADPDSIARDFWLGVGRVTILGAAPRKPPDLSGAYKVEGGTEKKYSTTLDMKRTKTFTTPQGAKFNVYELTWNFNDGKVKGVGMMLGSRFYVGYGSENLMLGVAAPFAVMPAEQPAYDHYRELMHKIKGKQEQWRYFIKDPPWFAGHYRASVATGYPEPEYYMLWVNPKGGYGQKFVGRLIGEASVPWSHGLYYGSGTWLKDNGEPDDSGSEMPPHWHIRTNGQNFNVHCRETETYKKGVEKDSDVDGTSFVLDDGTVVMILGGNDQCGVSYYEVRDKTLVGTFVQQFTDGRGVETLTPSAEVIEKNPQLFAN